MTIHPAALTAIAEHLEAAGHGTNCGSALCRPVRNIRTGKPDKAITSDGICKMVNSYGEEAGLPSEARVSSFASGHGRHQRSRKPDRPGFRAEVAQTCEHLHHPALGSKAIVSGGQPDIQGQLLSENHAA